LCHVHRFIDFHICSARLNALEGRDTSVPDLVIWQNYSAAVGRFALTEQAVVNPLLEESMPNSKIISHLAMSALWFVLGGCLIFLQPGIALAQSSSPTEESAEKCTKCHTDETKAWADSPHAKAATGAVTCESCHGPYVEDHPKDGIMQLGVDSASCQKCHTETYEQWQDSAHGRANVQCIGCHLSHSQEFRLSDKALCAACHRERLDTAHGQADISCVDCHRSPMNVHELESVSASEASLGVPAASHDFTTVPSRNCASCHDQVAHREDIAPVSTVRSLTAGECQPELIAKLEATQRTNKSLQTMTPISLGFGMGIGGTLGIIFMLILGYINQKRMQP
jgi:hypothetical protein